MFPLAVFLFSNLLMMSGTRAQKKMPTKSQGKAIVDDFRRAGTDRLFYVENVLRATQTRVISLPDVLYRLNAIFSLPSVSLSYYSTFYRHHTY